MAVYTDVPPAILSDFLQGYDLGTLVSVTGIAQGVENSNFIVRTDAGRFILTLYEKRVQEDDLPYFIALMTHLADRGLPVPRPMVDRKGQALQWLRERHACLIQFMAGQSPEQPNIAQCHAAGAALARLHDATQDFAGHRDNALGLAAWKNLASTLHLDAIVPGLAAEVAQEVEAVARLWPHDLPRGVIHADLFPDNVLFQDDQVTGLIDFYFACNDLRVYDLAVMHSAWAFSEDGRTHHADYAAALNAGYASARTLTPQEWQALPILCRGACLRFLLTRAHDWVDTDENAFVQRKDPTAYLHRLRYYRALSAS